MQTQTLAVQERRHWLESLDQALDHDPDAVTLLYERATTLDALGDVYEAEATYKRLLAIDPKNFWGLCYYGCLLVRQKRYVEAFQIHGALLRQNPTDATALAHFGYLLKIGGDLTAARVHYEMALQAAPHHTIAHRGLATVLRAQGLDAQAEKHEAAGAENRAFFPRQYRGQGKPREALLFVSERENSQSLHADRFLDEKKLLVTKCVVERIEPGQALPAHDVLVNGIGDADAARDALKRLTAICAMSSAAIINSPHAMLQTGRREIAERLASIPGVKTPKMLELSRAQVEDSSCEHILAQAGFHWPVLVRLAQYHAGKFFYKVDSREAWHAVVQELPPQPVLVIEYLDTREGAELYHKYRMMSIGGRLYPAHLAFSHNWKVHYLGSEMSKRQDLRDVEARFLQHPQACLGPIAWQALRQIADIMQLEYCGVDFAVMSDGFIRVFEANATMVVTEPGVQPHWAYRRPAYETVISAAHALIDAT